MRTVTRPSGRQSVAYNCGRGMGRHNPGVAIVARVFGFMPREVMTPWEWEAYIVAQHHNWWPAFLQGVRDGLSEWKGDR